MKELFNLQLFANPNTNTTNDNRTNGTNTSIKFGRCTKSSCRRKKEK